MDINRLIREGMRNCGRVLKILPEEEIGSPKEYMMDVITNVTLPSLNYLYPHVIKRNISISNLISIGSDGNGHYGYRIPEELTDGLKIQGIREIYNGPSNSMEGMNGAFTTSLLGTASRYAGYPNKYGRYSSANLYESVILANTAYADLQLLGQFTEAPIPKFQPPNILWVKDSNSSTSFNLTILTDNDESLISLPDHCYEGTRRLFILDLKASIYSEYGMLSSIDTPVGTIDLKIDDWSGAQEQRDSLYDEFNTLSHLRRHSVYSG